MAAYSSHVNLLDPQVLPLTEILMKWEASVIAEEMQAILCGINE